MKKETLLRREMVRVRRRSRPDSSAPHGLAEFPLVFGGELGEFPFEASAEGEGVGVGLGV